MSQKSKADGVVTQCGKGCAELASETGEAANFATYFAGSPAAASTPHLYISVLATWSRNTTLCQKWKRSFTAIPTFIPGAIEQIPLITIQEVGTVNSVSFSTDGTRIVSGSYDKSVRVWDASTGQQLQVLNDHVGRVTSVSFSADGTQIVSGSEDKSVRVWDAWTGQQLQILDGHTDQVTSVSFRQMGHELSLDQTNLYEYGTHQLVECIRCSMAILTG